MRQEVRPHHEIRRPSQVYTVIEDPRGRPRSVDAPAAPPRWADLAVSAVFLVAIAMPLAGLLCSLDASFVLEENRSPVPRPTLAMSRAALSEFPSKFEAYFNDHFGFRKRLINWLALAKVAGLGVSPSPDVIVGKGGWLYFGGHGALQDYRGEKPFTDEQLERYRQIIESRRDWLGARNPLLLCRHAQQGVDLPRVHAPRL